MDASIRKGIVSHFARQLLRPVISLLTRSGITYRGFADLAKSVFVEVATKEFGIRGRPTNVSRTAVLTGLTRREVKKQRDRLLQRDDDPATNEVGCAARMLTGWHTDDEFSEDGVPRELVETGEEASFHALWRRYGSADIPATTLLNEFTRIGAVQTTSDGRLRVLKRYYMPASADPRAVERAGSVLEDLGMNVRHNLLREEGEATRFEGRAISVDVPAAVAGDFREMLEHRGQAFLEEIDEWLARRELNEGDAGNRVRLGVGVYEIRDGHPCSKKQ